MTEMRVPPFLVLCLSGALLWLFAHAALTKLTDRAVFAHQLAGYGLAGPVREALVWGVPGAEILVAALLVGPWRQAGALGACALLLVYAGAMGWQRAQGHRVDCGCGGSRSLPVSWALVMRNLLLAAGAGTLLLPASPVEWRLVDNLLAVLAVLLSGVLYAAMHQVFRGRSSWMH